MRIFIITLFSLMSICVLKAQDVKFSVETSSDSILFGNYFKVTFSIENASANNFEAPSFQHFSIIGGPNQSSSFSMVNGVTSQSMTYSYYLEPKEEGVFFIEPASVEVEDKIIETAPLEIKVAPNPEGIIQSPDEQKNRTFDSIFGKPFFHKEEVQPKKKPKKKKKIYKI